MKAALTREQVFTATAGRAATVQKIALGAEPGRHPGRPAPRLVVQHTDTDRSFVEPTSHGTSREWYATKNLAISQKIVPLNIPPTTFMRAPGEAPGSFALESAMDELAVALGMDPIELRLRNNSTAPPGKDLQWSSKHLDECFRDRRGPLRLGAPHPGGPHRRRLARRHGRGHRDVPRAAVPGHGRDHAAGRTTPPTSRPAARTRAPAC